MYELIELGAAGSRHKPAAQEGVVPKGLEAQPRRMDLIMARYGGSCVPATRPGSGAATQVAVVPGS